MLVVRPAGPEDFEDLMELAVRSGRGFTSLPEHEPTLRQRLVVSQASFRGDLSPQEAWYTLMLEDLSDSAVLGVAGVKGAVGISRPFYSFRVVTMTQSSPILSMRFDHKALVLVNECTGWSEVGSLFLKPERRKGGAGRLLAQSRYMLIGAEPDRFNDMVLAELRGWADADGAFPFWDHVASKFFRLPFDEADRMSASTDGQFILDLAPRNPIYLELLPIEACESVGKVHDEGVPAHAMLASEGFRYQGLVDIFDAGPTMAANRDDIRTVRGARNLRVEIGTREDGPAGVISTTTLRDFRAVRGAVVVEGETVVLTQAMADALRVAAGDIVRVKS